MAASVKVKVMVACNQGYEARARGTPFQNCLYSNRRALRAFTGWMAGWIQRDREVAAQKALDRTTWASMSTELARSMRHRRPSRRTFA